MTPDQLSVLRTEHRNEEMIALREHLMETA